MTCLGVCVWDTCVTCVYDMSGCVCVMCVCVCGALVVCVRVCVCVQVSW